MSLKIRTRLFAWILLSVFVPMMVMLSLHHHEAHHDHETACVECAHHLPHAGHLSSEQETFHDCVLCQFYGVPYLLSSLVQMPSPSCFETVTRIAPCTGIVKSEGYAIPQRGPPSCVC